MCVVVFLHVCSGGNCAVHKCRSQNRMSHVLSHHSLNLELDWQLASPSDARLRPHNMEVTGRCTAWLSLIHSCWRLEHRTPCLHSKLPFTVEHLPQHHTHPSLFHFHSRRSKIAHNLLTYRHPSLTSQVDKIYLLNNSKHSRFCLVRVCYSCGHMCV